MFISNLRNIVYILSRGETNRKDAIRIANYAIEKRYSLTRYERENEKYKDLRFKMRTSLGDV